jgi:hypothetical protein
MEDCPYWDAPDESCLKGHKPSLEFLQCKPCDHLDSLDSDQICPVIEWSDEIRIEEAFSKSMYFDDYMNR